MGKTIPFVCIFLLISGSFHAPASGKTGLDVEIGWNGAYRMGRWAPIFVTATDDQPRNVTIEISMPHDSIHGMRIRQNVTIGPTQSTFPLYVPLGLNTSGLSVTLRDAAPGGRRLAFWDADEALQSGMGVHYPQATSELIGVSGRSRLDRLLEVQLSKENMNRVQSIAPSRLPASAEGYDALDLLILDEPDFARISGEQQQAIIDWIRAGGRVLCWVGSDAISADAAIAQQLPAAIGENFLTDLSDATLRSAGLAARFRQLKSRRLQARPNVQAIPLFDESLVAYRTRIGFGSITLLPFNPSTLMFSSVQKTNDFWAPIIGTLAVEDQSTKKRNPAYYNPYNDPIKQSQQQAANAMMDQLGDVPGAGSFGFSYVVLVMVGLMLIVGPIDWIVLKKLNHQPWTWATTGGWIILVTFGAVFIGHVVKSGDLHFRTIQIIDQADGATLATIDAFGIYSPRTSEYQVRVDPQGWWEPLSADFYSASRRAMTDLDFHEDSHGNRPQTMGINVWNLQFLKAETMATSPPVVESNLAHETKDGDSFIVGTVTNRSDTKISGISIRFHDKIISLPATTVIERGATLTLNEPLSKAIEVRKGYMADNMPYEEDHEAPRGKFALPPQYNLAALRAMRVDEILTGDDDMACLYATSANSPSSVQLETSGAIEKHTRYIRALVPLKKGGI